MYKKCRHIKPNGLRCESPALKEQNFCYFHSKIHTIGGEPYARFGPMLLPSPEGPAAILLSIAKINDALLQGRIDSKCAGILLYGMQIASQHLESHIPTELAKALQSFETTLHGDELAPEEFIEVDKNKKNETSQLWEIRQMMNRLANEPEWTGDKPTAPGSPAALNPPANPHTTANPNPPSEPDPDPDLSSPKIEPSPCPPSSNIFLSARRLESPSPADSTPAPPSTG
jgi:hypothetical protein